MSANVSGNSNPLLDRRSPYHHEVRLEQLARETTIATETMQLIREQLADCVRNNFVNMYSECKDLREQYFALCTDKHKGKLVPPGVERSPVLPGIFVYKPPKVDNN
jgi:hypothetical protein